MFERNNIKQHTLALTILFLLSNMPIFGMLSRCIRRFSSRTSVQRPDRLQCTRKILTSSPVQNSPTNVQQASTNYAQISLYLFAGAATGIALVDNNKIERSSKKIEYSTRKQTELLEKIIRLLEQ